MYFDERMKISDEKENPLGKGAFHERKCLGEENGYLQGKDRKIK